MSRTKTRGLLSLIALLMGLSLANVSPAMAQPVDPSTPGAIPVATPTPWAPRQLTATLGGSGATFPNPLYQAWIQVYKQNVPNVTISYQGVGSGAGTRNFIGYLSDFGGTDAFVSSKRVVAEAPDTLHVPMVLGAVVPTYNLTGTDGKKITGLRFNAEILAGIYLGAIRFWDDGRIAKANPDVTTLPNKAVTPVYRSDSSGTTNIWTDYLTKVSPDWKATVGAGTTVRWPAGIGAPGNPGVASAVLRTDGAIGYVELIFALANGLPAPAVQNAAGAYVSATTASVLEAAANAPIAADLTGSITNPPGEGSYPVAGFTWILVRQNTYTDATKAQALADFLYWGLTDGSGAVTRLGYVPLPQSVRYAAIGQLRKITVDGQPVFEGLVK